MWQPYERLPAGRRRMLGIGAVVTVLVVWAVLAGAALVSPAKLPAPWKVARAFWRLAWDPDKGESPLLTATSWSLMRILVAAVLVVLVGLPIGFLMGSSARINALLSPLVDPFRSAPVVALLPILVMWLGIGEA